MKIKENLKRFSFVPLFLVLLLICWFFDRFVPNSSRRLYSEIFVCIAALFSGIFTLAAGFSIGNGKNSTNAKKKISISIFSVISFFTLALPVFEIIFFNDATTRVLYYDEELTILAFEFILIIFGVVSSYFAFPTIVSFFQKRERSLESQNGV